jgi:hypothetical protein
MLRARAAAILLLVAVVLPLSACKDGLDPIVYGRIEGQVLDFETGAPIAGAGVTTGPPTNAVVTDNSGRFVLPEVPVQNYTITASRFGYNSNTVTVGVQQEATTSATIFLRQDEDDPGTEPNPGISVEVLGFITGIRNDSTIARVEYRVKNLGDADIATYEAAFRIDTNVGPFFQEVNGEELLVGQFDIGSFDKYIGNSTVTGVTVEGSSFVEAAP